MSKERLVVHREVKGDNFPIATLTSEIISNGKMKLKEFERVCVVREFQTDELLKMCEEGFRDKFPHVVYLPVEVVSDG